MNIWFTGIPGSKWSGIDIHMRHALHCDRTDESAERTHFHRHNERGYTFNGHRGTYWGPGQGCGEHWTDLALVGKDRMLEDIGMEFTGEGYRVIKSHAFARYDNLDFIYDNFKGDWLVMIQRDPAQSFVWWDAVMSFDETVYPSYNKMYSDPETMKLLLVEEDEYIKEFAATKGFDWHLYDPQKSFIDIPGFDAEVAKDFTKNHDDVYISVNLIT